MNINEILNKCDHTLLLQTATTQEIIALCDDALKFKTASVCVPPCYVKTAADYLKGRVKVCHFKDWMVKTGDNAGSITELGCGNIDLDACYRTCKEIGIPYIVYEQDINFRVCPYESTAVSYKNLVAIHERNK